MKSLAEIREAYQEDIARANPHLSEETLEELKETIEEVVGRYIVKYEEGTNFQDILNDYPELGAAENLSGISIFIFVTESEELLDTLENDSRIKRITPDEITMLPPVEMEETF